MISSANVIPRSDALSGILRQETHLQLTIQQLLDAQSEGLLAGLHGGQSPDAFSIGNRTPITDLSTPQYDRNGIVPVRQPAKPRIGLQGARKGIAKALSHLARLKGEEASALDKEVAQRETTLSSIQGLESKPTRLRSQITDIESEPASQRVEDLKQQSKILEHEIYDTETKLYEMKAQRRHLLREADRLSNSMQSKLSSYQSALALAEKEVQQFLSRSPAGTSNRDADFWSLPKERRTLGLANDHYKGEQQTLKERLQAVQAEEAALEEGTVVWDEVIQDVRMVENTLRVELQRMQTPSANSKIGMKGVLKTIENSRSRLQSKLDQVENNQWTLLVCCIGAELEALIQGQGILEVALGSTGESAGGDDDGKSQQTNGSRLQSQSTTGDLVGDRGLHIDPSPSAKIADRSEDEDDGPGPELLVSHHEDGYSQDK